MAKTYLIMSGNRLNPWVTNIIEDIQAKEPESQFWVMFSGTRLGYDLAQKHMGHLKNVSIEWDHLELHEKFPKEIPSNTSEEFKELESFLKPGAMSRIIMSDRYFGHAYALSAHPEVSNKFLHQYRKQEQINFYLTQLLKWLLKGVSKYKPSAIFCYCVAGSNAMALWEIADVLKIPFRTLDHSRISEFHHFGMDPYNAFTQPSQSYKKIKEGNEPPFTKEEIATAKNEIDQFRKSLGNSEDWELCSHRFKKINPYYALKSFVGNSLRWKNWDTELNYVPGPFSRIFMDSLSKVRGWLHLKSCEIQTLDEVPEDCIYVPLHVDPEASTMVQTPFIQNQSFMIENLVRTLGVNHKIVVKEHAFSFGWRKSEFYKKLRELPNVFFANPTLPGPKLLAKCKAVATITGTTGLQALLLGKPVVYYGKPVYQALNQGYLKVSGWNDLSEKWGSYIQNFKPVSDEAIIEWMVGVMRASFKLSLTRLWTLNTPEECREQCAEPIRVIAEELVSISSQYSKESLHVQQSPLL